MTDIHCHILPGFDDGSPSVGESVRMAEMAYASGIRRTVATPHFSALNGDIRRASEEIGRLFASLTEAVDGAGISLKLYLGAEVLCTPEIPRLLSKGLIPTVAGTDYVLTEFFFDAPTEYMDNMLDEIRSIGFIPIIAHPERYGAVQEDTTVLAGWFGKGYIIQMNKGSARRFRKARQSGGAPHRGSGTCSRYCERRTRKRAAHASYGGDIRIYLRKFQ